MSDAKLTLIGFYQYDKMVGIDFFQNLVMPAEINHDTLVYTILDRGGEYETIQSDPDFLKAKMLAWSSGWYETFTRWVAALAKEYDALENYDRMETWTDTGHSDGHTDSNSTNNTHTDTTVSAMDSATLVPQDATGTKSTLSGDSDVVANSNNTHEGRVHGNIGVVTSDQMLSSHMATRLAWGNIYNHIADLFLHDFVIPLG